MPLITQLKIILQGLEMSKGESIMLYYVSPKESDLIDLEPMNESQVMDYARSVSNTEPNNLNEAIKILSDNGYDVFTGD